jgi:hypothetical protein
MPGYVPDFKYGFTVYNLPSQPGLAAIDRVFVGPMEYDKAVKLWYDVQNEFECTDIMPVITGSDLRVNWL